MVLIKDDLTRCKELIYFSWCLELFHLFYFLKHIAIINSLPLNGWMLAAVLLEYLDEILECGSSNEAMKEHCHSGAVYAYFIFRSWKF